MPIQIQAPDGSIVEFPDGTDDATITNVMRQNFGGPEPQAATATAEAPSQAPAAAEPQQSGNDLTGLARTVLSGTPAGSLFNMAQSVASDPDLVTYVAQQADRGIADALGAPVDLMTGALNAGAFGIDKLAELFGGNFDGRIRNPVGGSDMIADLGRRLYESAGGHVVAPEEVSPTVRTAGMAARGATAAAVPAFGLASKAGQSVEALAPLAKPYGSAAGSTLARDAAAGAGAGGAQQTFDEAAPDSVRDSFAGPLLKALASLAGGVGGAGFASIAEGGARGAANAARNAVVGKGDPNAPVNSATGQPFTRTEMDNAARIAQKMPTSRGQALSNIDENAADFAQFATPEETPTVGMLADDIGMASQENVLRTRNPQRFAERDAQRRGKASRLVDQSAPEGANGRDFTTEAQRQYDTTLDTSRKGVETAEAAQSAAKQDIQRQNADLEQFRASQPQVSSAMAEDFDSARRAARADKNAAYDAVDPKTPVENGNAFLGEAVRRIDADMPQAERMAGGPYAEIAGRVRTLAQSDQPVTYGDLKAIRAQISEARKGAVAASGQSAAGSGADVQRLGQLGDVVSRMAEEINPEAARFYREEYAPRFKQGKAGEYGAALDRATRTGGESSATRPSEFGEKFLRKPEDAASLKRAIPGEQTERNAKEWMLGDLAKSGVLTDNAEIRYDKFKQWADRNRQTINQFPKLAQTVDKELAAAQRGGVLSKQLAADVAEAKRGLRMTERELQSSALQSAIGKNPANAVGAIMGSGDPEKQMAEMVGRLKGNKEATDGLKAATRDWIKQKAGLTSKIVGDPDAVRLSRAKMESLFQKHEDTLAKIYTPEEMNALRQAHKLLDAESKLDVRATAGSNTMDKHFADQRADYTQKQRLLEAALKAKFGVLKGGGVFRTINLFLQSLPDGARGLEDILFEMQFNPDLAKHLLTRPVKDVGSPAWNAKLNALLAGAAGGRESGEEPANR